jgi:hypothetical protein
MISVPHPSQIGDFTTSTHTGDRPKKRRALESSVGEGVIELDEDMHVHVEENENDVDDSAWTKGSVVIPESECEFTSILQLRQEAPTKGNQGKSSPVPRFQTAFRSRVDVTDIMLKHAFVGIVDLRMGLSLIQYSTKLYLASHANLA